MSAQQEIPCPNRDTGCQEISNNQKDYELHLQSCGFNQMPCPQECTMRVLKRNLINHLQNECPRRLVMCIYCKKEMCDENLRDHQADCDYKRVKCEYCDTFGIQKKDLNPHYDFCEKKPRDCTLKVFGCDFSGPKAEYNEHVADLQSHFPMLVKTIVDLKKELTTKVNQIYKLTQEGNAIKRRLITLEESQKNQASEIKDLKGRLGDVRQQEAKEGTTKQKKGPSSVASSNKSKNKKPQNRPSTPSNSSEESQDTIIMDNMEPITSQKTVDVREDNRWIIHAYENLMKSQLKLLWSDKVYSSDPQGYNFSLCLMIPPRPAPPKKNIHVGLFISILRGTYDDYLTWPFPFTVQMGFVNQKTKEEMEACRFSIHTTKEEYRVGFNKPLSIRNRMVGHPSVMSLKDLENPSKGYLMNNQIIIYVRLMK